MRISTITLSIFTFILFSAVQSNAQVKWMSLEEALVAQKENPKKIMVKIETEWCYYCKKMNSGAYANDKVIEQLNNNFYAVRFDAEQENDVQFRGKTYKYYKNPEKKRGINKAALAMTDDKLVGYPTIIILDEQQNRISPLANYMKAGQMDKFLEEYNDK